MTDGFILIFCPLFIIIIIFFNFNLLSFSSSLGKCPCVAQSRSSENVSGEGRDGRVEPWALTPTPSLPPLFGDALFLYHSHLSLLPRFMERLIMEFMDQLQPHMAGASPMLLGAQYGSFTKRRFLRPRPGSGGAWGRSWGPHLPLSQRGECCPLVASASLP